MKRITRLLLFAAIVGMVYSCAPLPTQPTDTSTPDKLAMVIVKSLVKNDESLFDSDLLLSVDSLTKISEALIEEGQVSLDPEYVKNFEQSRKKVIKSWNSVRAKAENDGVLWKTAKYYGCRYKIRQHSSHLPVSMTFEIYFQSGGYFYLVKIDSIEHQQDYFVFDSMSWGGEVECPEHIAS